MVVVVVVVAVVVVIMVCGGERCFGTGGDVSGWCCVVAVQKTVFYLQAKISMFKVLL